MAAETRVYEGKNASHDTQLNFERFFIDHAIGLVSGAPVTSRCYPPLPVFGLQRSSSPAPAPGETLSRRGPEKDGGIIRDIPQSMPAVSAPAKPDSWRSSYKVRRLAD